MLQYVPNGVNAPHCLNEDHTLGLVGFDRYQGQRATQNLNAACDLLRLWVDFFQPSMKLVEKHRVGSKVDKKHDRARTPYQRLFASQQASHVNNEKLDDLFRNLDPVALRRRLEEHLNALSDPAVRKRSRLRSGHLSVRFLIEETRTLRLSPPANPEGLSSVAPAFEEGRSRWLEIRKTVSTA